MAMLHNIIPILVTALVMSTMVECADQETDDSPSTQKVYGDDLVIYFHSSVNFRVQYTICTGMYSTKMKLMTNLIVCRLNPFEVISTGGWQVFSRRSTTEEARTTLAPLSRVQDKILDFGMNRYKDGIAKCNGENGLNLNDVQIAVFFANLKQKLLSILSGETSKSRVTMNARVNTMNARINTTNARINTTNARINNLFSGLLSLLMPGAYKAIYAFVCVLVSLSKINAPGHLHRNEVAHDCSTTPFTVLKSLIGMNGAGNELCEDKKDVSSKHSKFKSLDFLFNWKNHYPERAGQIWSRNSYSVYSVESYMDRVASFSGVSTSMSLPIMKLSQNGFYHTKEGSTLQCSDCASIVQGKDFASPPSDKKYHASPKCQFATTGSDDEISTKCERVDPDLLSRNKGAENDSTREAEVKYRGASLSASEIPDEAVSGNGHDSLRGVSRESEENPQEPLSGHVEQEDVKQENVWLDEKLINQEAEQSSVCRNPKKDLKSVECTKPHIHNTLIPLTSLRNDENIPSDMRNDEIKKFTRFVAKLTVKVLVCKKSIGRPRMGEDNKAKHFGSGIALVDGVDRAERWMKEATEGSHLPESQLACCGNNERRQSPVKSNSGEKYFYFSVMTSTHVIFDQLEAENSKVEFFYDSTERKNVRSFDGVAVKRSLVEGEYKSYLVCRTSDKDFIKWLYQARQEFNEHVIKMHRHAKEILTKSCFVVFHPHGMEKRVSFGKCASTKYALMDVPDSTRKEMVYLSDEESLSTASDQREVLHYTANTCPGSSGSAVFTFRQTKEDDNQEPNLHLAMWVHNGTEKFTGLGSSVMKAVDPRICNPDERPIPLKTVAQRLRGQSTVARKGVPPLYPNYYSVEKRLESFKDDRYMSNCKHSPAELAAGGFFYTGTSPDCVRCFYCGLGIKAWRSTDDLYVEHKRSRSSCSFLKLCLKFEGQLKLDLLQEEYNTTVSSADHQAGEMTTELTASLLEKENKLLKIRQSCRMCFRYDNKELFLPCGEIIVCNACMDILSACPSCDQKIDATVSVFLS